MIKIQWYCQVVATDPGSDLDNTMARKEDPSQHDPADKTDIGEQMFSQTISTSYSKHESSCEDSEIFPPQARNCLEMEGEMKTKGYSANYMVVGSEDTYLPDDHETSVNGGVWHRHEEEEHCDRILLLRNIYTNTRMLEIDHRPEKV